MPQPEQHSIDHLCSRVIWHMARHHGWGQWTPREVVFSNAFTNSEQHAARDDLLPAIKRGEVVAIRYRDDALRLDGSKRAQIAYYLRDVGGYSELRIEATLSRFEGFDRTESPHTELLES